MKARINSPDTSIVLKVSNIGSIGSSAKKVNLLFCKLSVSNEFKFSNARVGSIFIL